MMQPCWHLLQYFFPEVRENFFPMVCDRWFISDANALRLLMRNCTICADDINLKL